MREKNPFRRSFFGVAVICCFFMSIVFFYINYLSNRQMQLENNQQKINLIEQDLKGQLKVMEELSVKIASDYTFQPFYFTKAKSRELTLVDQFDNYRKYSALTEESFLYYGGSRLFLTGGSTMDLNFYLRDKVEDAVQEEIIKEQLLEMTGKAAYSQRKTKLLAAPKDVYILFPFRVSDGAERVSAVLGFVVKKQVLDERFEVVSGGIDGNLTLCGEDDVLFCNQQEPGNTEQKGVLTAADVEGRYEFYYLPTPGNGIQSSIFWLQFLLVMADILLVFLVAEFFAAKSYRPLQELSEKYRGNIRKNDIAYEDALEELDGILVNMLESNMIANQQILQKQAMLQNQVLRMLLEGSVAGDVKSYLDRVQIAMPHPYYYVVSLLFPEENVTEEFLDELQRQLGLISEGGEDGYVYAVSNLREKILYVICNIQTLAGKEELTEIISTIAESFSFEPIIGEGSVYQSPSGLSASRLESIESIQSQKRRDGNEDPREFIYDKKELQRIVVALENCDRQTAAERLTAYVAYMRKEKVSLLMLHYIFADFISEINSLCKKYQLELPVQTISLLATAMNLDTFEPAAITVIRDFCQIFEQYEKQDREEQIREIYEYILLHYTEYDLSIEKVAQEMNTTAGVVRQAVLKHTGKMYRDLLIHLRIEYAKKLLLQGDMTVAEVCQKVGYGNLSYFTKLFREMAGVTPAKYRKG